MALVIKAVPGAWNRDNEATIRRLRLTPP